VIQTHLPVRLPCYDLVLLAKHTFDIAFPRVRLMASGALNSGDLTGGVYKTRERIHRSMADLRLLAIPTSRRRIAAFDPNWGRLFRLAPPRGFATHCTDHCSTCVALGVRAILT